MAAPTYTSDLDSGVIYTDGGTWTTLTGRTTDPDTDDYIQGASCWSHDPFSSGIEGGVVNSSQTITAGAAVFVWTKADISPALATHAAGGVQVLIGNASTALKAFYVAGSDDLIKGGWKSFPVDPTLTQSTSIGTPTTATAYFGVRWNVPATGPNKGYPFKIDAIRWGTKIDTISGDATTPATFADTAAYDAISTRQWGICQPTDSGAEVQGIINFGTATNACHFDDDSGDTIIIIDTEWTSTTFTKIVIDHASTVFNMDGLTIKALGTNNPGQLVFNNASTTSALDNNVFASIGITTLRAGVTATNNKWTLTDTVTQNGATLDTCTFDKLSSTSSLVVDDLSLVTDCTFNSDGSNHAVNLGTVAATTSMTWENYINSYETYNASGTSTGNEAILVSVASGQTLTINVSSGYDTPSFYNTGTGTVTVVNSVTVNVYVKDEAGNIVSDAACSVYKVSDDTQIMNELSVVTTGLATESYAFVSDTPVYIRVRKSSTGTRYYPANTSGTITSAGLTVTVVLIEDKIVT